MACSSLEEEEKKGKIIMEYNMQFFLCVFVNIIYWWEYQYYKVERLTERNRNSPILGSAIEK